MSYFTQKYCAECGEAPVPHKLEKFSQRLDEFMFRSSSLKSFFVFFEREALFFVFTAIRFAIYNYSILLYVFFTYDNLTFESEIVCIMRGALR